MRRRLTRRILASGLLPGLLAGCYGYHQVVATPPPSSRISVVLSDYGRLEAGRQIGPHTSRVEGSVLAITDTGYLVAVSGVKPIAGEWVRWTGETVSLRPDYVSRVYERRLSKSRTALFAAGAAAATLAIVVGFDLFGFGNNPIDIAPGPGDPGDQ